jgi:hypothetical protein
MFGHFASFSMTSGQRGPSAARLRSAACAAASTASVAIAIPAAVHFHVRVTKHSRRERVKFEANCFQFIACGGNTISADRAIVNGRINAEFGVRILLSVSCWALDFPALSARAAMELAPGTGIDCERPD